MDDDRKRRKGTITTLLLLPLLGIVVFCAAQAGLFFAQPQNLDIAINAETTADYSTWPPLNYRRVDPRLATLVLRANWATASPFLATEIAAAATEGRTPDFIIAANSTLDALITTPSISPTASANPTNYTPSSSPTANLGTNTATGSTTTTVTTTATGSETTTVSPTATATVSSTVTATVTSTNSSTPTSTAIPTSTMTATSTSSSTPTSTATATSTPVPVTDLRLTKSVNTTTPNEGENITYLVTVTNDGPLATTGVVVNDSLPSGTNYSSHTASQGTYDNGTGDWIVGNLGVGASATLQIDAQVASGTGGSTIVNTATITGSSITDSNTTNNSSSATIAINMPPNADLALTKTVSNNTPLEGDTVTYTVTVTNNGPDPTTGVSITDNLPSGVTYSSHTATQGTYSGGNWSVGNLNVGASATLQITVTINSGTVGTTITNTATVSASSLPDLIPGNDSASASVTVQPPPTADLVMAKTVDISTPAEGDTVTYTVTVTNNGPDPTTGVSITDNLPSGVTYSSHTATQGTYSGSTWSVGNLGVGASATLQITVTINAGTAGNIITNTTSISASSLPDPDPGNDSANASITVQAADLSLSKTASVPELLEGAIITFTVTVTNNGPDPTTGVTVTDNLPTGLTYSSHTASQGTYSGGIWSVGNLGVGSNATLQIAATVDAGTNNTNLTNTASVTASSVVDPNSGNDSDSVSIYVLPLADLALTKSINNPSPVEGGTIVYTVTLINNGPHDMPNVRVTDQLPSETTFVSSTRSQGNYNSGSGVWNVGTLPNGATATMTIAAIVNSGTAGITVTNTATITSIRGVDSASGNDSDSADFVSIPATMGADLAIAIASSDTTPNEDSAFNLTLTLTNSGPDTATGIEVTHLVPEPELSFVSATGLGTYNYSSGQGIWQIASLASGSSATISVRVNSAPGTGGLTVTSTATITALNETDPVPSNDSDSVNLDIQSRGLQIRKNVTDSTPLEGDTIEYRVTVDNHMGITATGVQVTDMLPTGVTYVTDNSGGTYNVGTGLWDVGSINSGTSTQLRITVTVDAGTQGTTITNTATITAMDQTDPYPTDNTDNRDITVSTAPPPPGTDSDLALIKTVSNSTPIEGEIIDYRVQVTNNGPDVASGVQITDILPTGVTYVSRYTAHGSYDVGTGVWDVVDNILVGDTYTLRISVLVDSGVAGSTVTNSATITASDQIDADSSNNSASISFQVLGADLAVSKTVDNPTPLQGDTITYTLTVTNNGPDDAPTGIQIIDVMPTGVIYLSASGTGTYDGSTGIWDVGALPNGTTATLDIVATIGSGVGGSTLTNSATITTFTVPDTNATNNIATVDITVLPSVDIRVQKSVDNPAPNEGDTVVYTVTVRNNGPDAATGVEISDLLPSDVSYVSDDGAGAYSGSLWTIGNLAAGSNTTLNITVTIDSGTAGWVIVNHALLNAVDQVERDSSNDSDSASLIVQAADVAVGKSVDNPSPNEGDTIVYTLTATNNGPDTVDGLVIADALPAGVTYVSDDSGGAYAAGLWSIGSLSAGNTATLNITVTVDAGTAGSTITNTAAVSAATQADPVPGNNSASATVTVPAADVAVGKTVDNPSPNEGDTIVYTLTATNNGPDAVDGLVITVALPVGVTYVSDSSGGASYAADLWAVGSLSAGNTATLNITVTVDAGTAGSTITNTATIFTAIQADPNPANDTGSVDITIPEVDLSISKTVDNATPLEGDTIFYTLSVTNNGPETATGITISDTLPVGVTYVADTPSQGLYASDVWDIGTLTNGSTVTLIIEVTVDVGTSGSTVTNTASILTLDQGDPNPTNDSNSANITVQ